ncbi:MAG TPA: hypothetical protein VJT49_24350 [Amycolatopsis sp.]|nr:hypothetical protein [Amycolatopsis sp.]HKS48183.1 hypothetical protein [Amycolatopsis sp.]
MRKRMGMLALVAVTGNASMVFGTGTASAATPFVCTGQVFLAQGVGSGTQLYAGRFGAKAVDFAPVGPVAPDTYNAIGYNSTDNYLYGIRAENGGLWRIDSTGAVTGLGRPSGLPAPGSTVAGFTLGGYNVGGFDDQRRLS